MAHASKIKHECDSTEEVHSFFSFFQRAIMSEPNANVVADLNKALINSNSESDKNEMAVLMMSLSVNREEFLTPAPMTIALLGQLMIIAGEKDFTLENQRPEKGFQHIEHPESFRACLVQVSNSGWRAFNEAHKVRTVRGVCNRDTKTLTSSRP